ncbi:MAG: ATP-binding protein [Symploca sp. SIO3E6]|nr:ATP-binding protein [Caldora sp. SIO3E6]
MTQSHQPDNITVDNERSLNKLAWAIEASVGRFKLIFARCNYTSLRSQLVERLRELTKVDIRILELKPTDRRLFARIQQELEQYKPDFHDLSFTKKDKNSGVSASPRPRIPASIFKLDVLMVFGLESVDNLEQLLATTNQVREEFRKHFPFPLILWINDPIMEKLLRVAPDFESWGTTREFVIATDRLIDFLQTSTEQLFKGNLNPTVETCREIQLACQELPNRQQELDLELRASIASLLGFIEYVKSNFDAALEHCQTALELWQQSNHLERQLKLLVDLAFCYYLKKNRYRKPDHPDVQATKRYIQQALDILEQVNRPDLSASSVFKLGDMLRDLQDWEPLQTLAQQALLYHQTQELPMELARDYGLLAEVALARERWQDAYELAKQALGTLSAISDLRSLNSLGVVSESVLLVDQSRYLLILAKVQQHLGQTPEALRNLAEARKVGTPEANPSLYLDILHHLHQLYFEQKQYSQAFEIKLEQRSIEQQYGFRAFIGAGWIKAQRQAKLAPTQIQVQETVAPEITAFGRLLNVEHLIERIARNDCKLIVIHGESGVGKSSLVYGGLVPALKQKAIGISDVVPVAMRVYTNWVEQLGKLLTTALEEKRVNIPVPLNSEAAILEQLQQTESLNLRTVLIFDQFEEFFFVYPDSIQRRQFFEFIGACLNILPVKVILSLRKDYLHYLLECNRLDCMKIIGNDVLTKNVLYELGNFSPVDAKAIIQHLTETYHFYLEPALIEQLVQDLAGNLGEVRPIELQIVGAQLQTDNITKLAQYRELGAKEELIKRYLAEVVSSCGAENKQVAELVLYLLTDEKGTRPLKTRTELERDLQVLVADLSTPEESLDLVLKIFVDSGLVVLLPELPTDRYQLVHDYLATFIRQQQEPRLNELIAQLEQEREQRQQLEIQVQTLLQMKSKGGRLTESLEFLQQEGIAEGELGHQILLHKEMTILFADIRSFTSLSETMSLKENFDFLNSYFSRIIPVVHKHNGFIDKYIGDAFLAIFPQFADDAVQAAIEIQKQISLYNSLRERIGERRITVGIGINTGIVMLGTVGEPERMETLVLSEEVNLASRVEGLTKTYRVDILISEQTLNSLRDKNQYNYRFIDRIKKRGSTSSICCFEVYDANPKPLIELKRQTHTEFEQGIAFYFQENFVQAQQVFQRILQQNEQDRVTQCYLEHCQTHIIK